MRTGYLLGGMAGRLLMFILVTRRSKREEVCISSQTRYVRTCMCAAGCRLGTEILSHDEPHLK
jgi:hypothetical protein